MQKSDKIAPKDMFMDMTVLKMQMHWQHVSGWLPGKHVTVFQNGRAGCILHVVNYQVKRPHHYFLSVITCQSWPLDLLYFTFDTHSVSQLGNQMLFVAFAGWEWTSSSKSHIQAFQLWVVFNGSKCQIWQKVPSEGSRQKLVKSDMWKAR